MENKRVEVFPSWFRVLLQN